MVNKTEEAYSFDDSDIPIKDEDLVWFVVDDDNYGSEDLKSESESESEMIDQDDQLLGGVLIIYQASILIITLVVMLIFLISLNELSQTIISPLDIAISLWNWWRLMLPGTPLLI